MSGKAAGQASKSAGAVRAQTSEHRPTRVQKAPQSSSALWLGLQRNAGNQAVQSLLPNAANNAVPNSVEPTLKGDWKALPDDTRAEMEVAFQHDFSGVRIHNGRDADESAQHVQADAYTVGQHIAFRNGKYAPDSPSGRTLLAHELAHVVQHSRAASFEQSISKPNDSFELHSVRAGESLASRDAREVSARNDDTLQGPAPMLLRQASSDGGGSDLAFADSAEAALIGALYGSPANTDTGVLLAAGGTLQNSFHSGGPMTRLTAAKALVGTYGVLQDRQRSARRDSGGALLRTSFADEVPWTDLKPHDLSEVDPFTPENLAEWTSYVVSSERVPDSVASTAKGASKAPSSGAKLPAGGQGAAPPAIADSEVTPSSGLTVGTGLRPDEQPPNQEQGGGAEISAGLSALKSVTIGAAANAIQARANAITPGTALQAPQSAQASLFSASGSVFYVGNRIYAIDRSGHIVPSGFAFDLSGTSLKAGVYFAAPFAVKAKASNLVASSLVLLRVDGGKAEAVGGDIYPAAVNTGLIPILEIMRAGLQKGGGIAVIVSSHRKKLSVADLSFKKVGQALARVKNHLGWAIHGQLKAMVENPLETLFQLAFSEGLGELAKRVPPVAAGLAMYHALRQVVWIADTFNIAAYAQTDDEIDLAAQAMAVELAGYIIAKLIAAGTAAAKAGARAIVAKPAAPPPGTPAKSTANKSGDAGGTPPDEGLLQGANKTQSGSGRTPTAKPSENASSAQPNEKPAGVPSAKSGSTVNPDELKKVDIAPGGAANDNAVPAKAGDLKKVTIPGGTGPAANDNAVSPSQPKSNVVRLEDYKAQQQAQQQADAQRPKIAVGSDVTPGEGGQPTVASATKPSSQGSSAPGSPASVTPKGGATGSAGGTTSTATPSAAPGPRARNTYPDFAPVNPTELPTAQAQVDQLSKQLKIPVPKDRVLDAPWIGKVRVMSGKNVGTDSSVSTSAGWLRSEGKFWSQFDAQFPGDTKLMGPGRTVTKALADKWGWPSSTVGQKLVHHHIGNGPYVVAVPENLHQGLSGDIHAKGTVVGKP